MMSQSRDQMARPYSSGLFASSLPFSSSKYGSIGHSDEPSSVSGTRKRSRHSSNPKIYAHTFKTSSTSTPAFSRISNTRSPPPLVNDQYELAGGMEGPDTGDYDDYYQLEKQRRGLWATPTATPLEGPKFDVDERTQPSSSTPKPWVLHQIISLVGGMAGKLVQFCAVPFSGFQAGGGQKYSVDSQGQLFKVDTVIEDAHNNEVQHVLPGEFPSDDYGVASLESLDDTPVRKTKRVRTGETWVVVDNEGNMESRASSPRMSTRRTPRTLHPASPSQIPRPVSRAGLTRRPSLIPVSRRPSQDKRAFQGSPTASSKIQHAASRSYSRQSYGSPVLFPSSNTSPLPPESQRLINKIRREGMEDDARMRKMSAQTAAMLKEAREALGSKFEIDESFMDMDGGSDDEGW